jgi:DNA-binding beta-propeller fold protein YncE
MYIAGFSGRSIFEYNLSTAWNISTASYLQEFSTQEKTLLGAAQGVFFKDDGTRMYVCNENVVNEYTLSTAWNISTSSFVYPTTNYFSVSGQESVPTGLFFKSDGLKMYVIGSSGDDVNEYTLSTAWNISTASYVRNFSVSTQDTSPQGVFFKPDGTAMYIAGDSSNSIHQYSLSTAWSLASVTFVRSFSVSAQEATPTGVFFKPDGLKMYVIGSASDNVREYTLSTAWDISSSTLTTSFSVLSQSSNSTGIFFKDDGTKMYISTSIGDIIFEYNLSTAWNISTASYLKQNYFTYIANGTSDLFFKPDGTKLFLIGVSGDSVVSFDLI